MFCTVAHRGTWTGRYVYLVSSPVKQFQPALKDSIFPQESVDNDTTFHCNGTGEEDKGDLLGKHLNALLSQLTVDRESSMEKQGEKEQAGQFVVFGQLDAQVQVAGREEVVQNVEDSDDENTNVLEVESSSGQQLLVFQSCCCVIVLLSHLQIVKAYMS